MKRNPILTALFNLSLMFSLLVDQSAMSFAGPPQSQTIAIGILGFQNETGTSVPPELGQKIAQRLQQKLLGTYKDVLPRIIATITGDAGNQLPAEQVAALGKQYGLKYVVRGGLLALNAENAGDQTRTTVQLYVTMVSVEDASLSHLRGEGVGAQKGAPAKVKKLAVTDFTGNEFKSSAAGLALASAIEQLATAIYQIATRTSPDTPVSNPQLQTGAGTEVKPTVEAKEGGTNPIDADAAKAANTDAELQQLVAQAEQFISSGSGSTETLKTLSQALDGLKSALASKADLLQQGKPADAAQADSEIARQKEALQAALATIAAAAADPAANSGSGPVAQQQNPERKNLLVTINEYMGEALAIIQKIQEMRAAFRSANQEAATGVINPPDTVAQQTSSTDPTGDPNAQVNPSGDPNAQSAGGSPPSPALTEEVSGVVTQTGQPVEGATVAETNSGATATTTGDGTYTLTGVLSGKLAQLVVSKAGKQIASGQIDVVHGQPNIADFQVSQASSSPSLPPLRIVPSVVLVKAVQNGKSGTVKGLVQDAQGKPVARALVNLSGLATARTDSSGQYLFMNVPEGAHQVTIKQSGLTPRAEQVRVMAAKLSMAKTQFTPADKIYNGVRRGGILTSGAGAVLRGKILDAQGQAVAGARVFVSQSTNAVSVITRTDGSYAVKPLNPGSYRVLVSKLGYLDFAQTVTVSARENEQHDFKLKNTNSPLIGNLIANRRLAQGEISGQVRAADGSFISYATVELRDNGKGSTLAKAMTDVRGGYKLKAPEGRYEMRVSQKNYIETLRLINVAAGGAMQQDFVLKGQSMADNPRQTTNAVRNRLPIGEVTKNGRIIGLVTDAKTGVPVAGASVSIPGRGAVITDRGGNYALLNLAPGNYQISVRKAGFSDEQKVLTLRAGESITLNCRLSARPMIFRR